MCEATPESLASVVVHEQLADWAALLAAEGLTREGLIWLRGQLAALAEADLACQHGEQLLRPCPFLLSVLLRVIEVLAPLRGLDPAEDDLWQRVVGMVPDSPAALG
jgi:hypothetical protein